jgi:hypothetical protein
VLFGRISRGRLTPDQMPAVRPSVWESKTAA